MTVVNPKSISGITSITTASGSDNLLTIHTSDANNTERVRVNSSGDVIVGSGVTLSPDGDAFFTGVCTATSFVGSGANLTGISGVSVANQSNNRVITNTGTTDALNAEANLTFDGSDLTITNSGVSNKGIKLTATGSYYPSIVFNSNRTGENQAIAYIRGEWNGTEVGAISIEAGDDTTNKDDGKITFYTVQGGTFSRKMAIEQDGNVHIDNGNLVIGTSGKGIDFSATANSSASGATMSNELLDDYEEGSWTPQIRKYASGNFGTAAGMADNGTVQRATYTKIGNVVTLFLHWDGFQVSDANYAALGGLPFDTASTGGGGGNVGFTDAFTSNPNNGLLVGSGGDLIYFYANSNAWNGWSTSSSRALYLQATYLTS